MQFQLGQRLPEEELAGQAETVHGALAILTDEYLVEVSLEDFLLAVMQLQQHRHHGFGEFTGQAAFVGQVEVLDQLLGQRTAALGHLAAGRVDPDSTGDRLRRHTPVAIEIAVFDSDQGFQQVRRHLIELDQDAIFKVFRVNTADQQRFKTHHRQLGAIKRRQLSHIVARETHAHRLGFFQAFVELEATGVQVDGITADRRSARAIAHGFAAVAQRIELGKEVFLAQLLAREQLQRACIHLGRNRPALAGEFFLHHGIEVHRKAGDRHKAHKAKLDHPAQPRARAAGRRFFTGTGRSGSSHGGGLYALY